MEGGIKFESSKVFEAENILTQGSSHGEHLRVFSDVFSEREKGRVMDMQEKIIFINESHRKTEALQKGFQTGKAKLEGADIKLSKKERENIFDEAVRIVLRDKRSAARGREKDQFREPPPEEIAA